MEAVKIKLEVIRVRRWNKGWGPDRLRVTCGDGSRFVVSDTAPNRRAYHVGREISVEITPK